MGQPGDGQEGSGVAEAAGKKEGSKLTCLEWQWGKVTEDYASISLAALESSSLWTSDQGRALIGSLWSHVHS